MFRVQTFRVYLRFKVSGVGFRVMYTHSPLNDRLHAVPTELRLRIS